MLINDKCSIPAKLLISDRLLIPEETQALLWDMDGVLLDTLGLDFVLCVQLLNKYAKKAANTEIDIPKDFIRSIFACHPPEFWRLIFDYVESKYKIFFPENEQHEILNEYNEIRNDSTFDVNQGIIEILTDCRKKEIKLAVVSNNPTADVEKILIQSGIAKYFDIIVGNDLENLKKKPAPDTYLYAARLLKVQPKNCVVIEDSVLGAEAGHSAGCFTIGVATGGHSFEELEQSRWPKQVYTAFRQNKISMQPGNISKKSIKTPNDFISHMTEHIAWRMGCSIDLSWNNNDWQELGTALGSEISGIADFKKQLSGTALGMIDDGSAEVFIKFSDNPDTVVPRTVIQTTASVDSDWFLSLRCEQCKSGKPLTELIQGMAQGLGADINIQIYGVEDPHHTWEGVFRTIGIVLGEIVHGKMCTTAISDAASDKKSCDKKKDDKETDNNKPDNNKPGAISIPKGIVIENVTQNSATVIRKTAETALNISVDFSRQKHENYTGNYNFNVSETIQVQGFKYLLDLLAKEAGFFLNVDFDAVLLNSSHVVMEDVGLVLGRALKEILIVRMNNCGVQGAGSSVNSEKDMETQAISVGLSVEGRKFLKFVPFQQSYEELRKNFLLNQTPVRGLFAEDLDDFIDGLAGGMGASIMIHIKKDIDVSIGWEMIFTNLGRAIKEAFQANPYRKGVPPGVKATLS